MISLKNSIYNVFSKERSEESYAFNFYSMEEQYITENDFINEEERREQINEIKKILHVLTPRQREIIWNMMKYVRLWTLIINQPTIYFNAHYKK